MILNTEGENSNGTSESTTQATQNYSGATSARSTLTKYTEYLECSPSHVVTEALKLIYRKDKDFQTWLSGQHTKASEPTSKPVSKGTSAKGESFQLELK